MIRGGSAIHCARAIVGLDRPHTQTTREEQQELVRHLGGAKTIVEIGVYEGSTTALLATHADPGAVIYGIDPFIPGHLGICWGEIIVRYINRRNLKTGRIILVKEFSQHAAIAVPEFPDVIFIDGDHSEAGISTDWNIWAPRVRPGGIVALHDSFPAPNSPVLLGSHTYFASTIALDRRFRQIAAVGSMAVLMRVPDR